MCGCHALLPLYVTWQILRRKIESIISRGDGEEDPDCPGCLEETKFWVVTKRIKTETTEQKLLGLYVVLICCVNGIKLCVVLPQVLSFYGGQCPSEHGHARRGDLVW